MDHIRGGTEDISPQRGGGKGILSRGDGQYRMWEVTRMSKEMAGSEVRSRQVCWADGCRVKGTESVFPGTMIAICR